MQVGDVISWTRAFTRQDVEAFTGLVLDRGRHHVEPDAQGRLMVHGLLTASLATRVGGALDYLAREMRFQFRRPVWTGDAIRCLVTITALEPARGGTRLEASMRCINQLSEIVMDGDTHGLIGRPLEDVQATPTPNLE
jgi:acyl dehydratase